MTSDDAPAADVATEVEVVRINPNRRRGLVVSAVAADGGPRLPAARLAPDEDPSDAARRVLVDIVGIDAVHHEPHFLGYHRYADRQHPTPTLTLSFLVLGPVPGNSRRSTTFVPVQEVLEAHVSGRAAIDHPQTVIDAQRAACELLETTPIALQLLGEKVAVFTLQQLLDVYQSIVGADTRIDISNFRRKVEAAHDFVRVCEPPIRPSPSRAPRGRPPRWYTAGDATRLEPPIRFRPNRG